MPAITAAQTGLELLLHPLVAEEFDLWLAALLDGSKCGLRLV